MMILNIINTIAIAIGIGSSVNNTNFNNEKKGRKKLNDEISIVINYNQQYLQEQVIGNTAYYKYTINGSNENYVNAYFSITNTTYVGMVYGDTNYSDTFRTLYKITNYYNTYVEFELIYNFQINAGSSYYWGRYYAQPTGVDLDRFYNMTMTNNFTQEFTELNTLAHSTGWVYTETGSQQAQNPQQIVTTTTNTIRLAPNETIQLYYNNYVIDYTKTSSYVVPGSLQIRGTLITPNINQEVVDVPGIMFTILSLPFSFISQAFNLTIFPGTPYQLNFTNLFMTIIAVFILLWLIKKILK